MPSDGTNTAGASSAADISTSPLPKTGQGGTDAVVIPLAGRAPRNVTRVFAPIGENRPGPPKGRPGGLRPGFRDVSSYEVPGGYGEDRVVALVRDPLWIYAYWEVTTGLMDRLRREHGSELLQSSRMVLRVHDVTGVNFDGSNSHGFCDVDVQGELGSWYVQVPEANRAYCVDLGLVTADGRFLLLARSNVVETPREGLSLVTDEEWLTIDEIYGMSVGLTEPLSSAALLTVLSRRLAEQVGSGAVSSISSPWMI